MICDLSLSFVIHLSSFSDLALSSELQGFVGQAIVDTIPGFVLL